MMKPHTGLKLHPNLILYCMVAQAMYALCSSVGNYRYPGETSPDRVEMAIGDSVNISCRMHPSWFPGKSSTDLYFVGGPAQEPVPQEDIVIVNSSTIVFMLRNATERQTSYICKIGKEAIMASKVNVGTAPKQVQDFNCRGYDYEYMLCKFTQPDNPILTQYNLTFYTYSLGYSYQPVCSYERKLLVVCNITLSQKYNPSAEYFHFTLKAINALGTLTQRFDINIWNSMIVARPGNDFRLLDVTTNKLLVSWKMLKYIDKLKGLQWEIMLKPGEGEAKSWFNKSDVQRVKSEVRLRLNELPYAYYWYTLKLRVRVRTAVDAENMWSEPFFYRFRTDAKRPDAPPRTDAGSFYVAATETQVRLYWEQLLEYEQNGANLSYQITEVKRNGNIVQQEPLQLELNSAVFSWQRDVHYEFLIKSRNHIGASLESSRIEIMPLNQGDYLKHIPQPIHNVYHAADRTYTLSWEPPESVENLLDYTVYWCYSKRALQNECKGSIHFKRIGKRDTKFTTDPQSVQEEHTLNMAVSANYLNYNTGMHWAPCTVDINSDLVKMSPEIQTTTATSIIIQWSPESVCPSILEGYNLTYCEMDEGSYTEQESLASTIANCSKPSHFVILNKNLKQYDLNGLKPYMNYKLEMFMYSRKKVGKSSDPLVVSTQEAAPSPPRQLQVSKITNISATISWLPPNQPNGHIRFYVVVLNNEKYRVAAPVDDSDPGTKLVFELQNLTSFTAYKVYVVAHTVADSDPSNDIHFTTLIGYPSMPNNVIIKENYNHTLIQWAKPLKPAGRVEFYEVAVIVKRNDEVIRKRITIVSGTTSCALQIPACVDHEYKTVFEVRAVNAALKTHEVAEQFSSSSGWDDDEIHYEGNADLACQSLNTQKEFNHYYNTELYTLFESPWQVGPTYGCAATRLSKITTIALMVIMLSLCVMAALYLARKKYNKMANIDCTLPPGLDNYPSKIGTDREASEKADPDGHYRSKELIFHNEKHHLLASLGNDSGYLGDGRIGNCGLVVTGDAGIPDYMRNTSESSADSLVENAIDNVELDVAEETCRSSLENNQVTANAIGDQKAEETYSMEILPISTGYIKSSKIIDWSLPEQTTTGYVSVGSITPSANQGYIQPQSLQKRVQPSSALDAAETTPTIASDGYTTFESLSKQSIEPQVCVQHESQTGGKADTFISGYVTQKDLTTLGQQRLN